MGMVCSWLKIGARVTFLPFMRFQLHTVIATFRSSIKEGGIFESRVIMDGGGDLLLITEDMKNCFNKFVEEY